LHGLPAEPDAMAEESMQHRGGLVAAVTFGCSSATSLTRHNSFGADLLAP